jgi:hypothetical protein
MAPPHMRRPAALAHGEPCENGDVGKAEDSQASRQWQVPARRQRQARHLHRRGPRCILEALIAVDSGEPLDAVLADFERLPPELYHATLYHYGALADEGASWI